MENLSEKIKTARTAFGISRAFMGEILGFGVNVLYHYENGEIPSKSNYLALRIAITPFGMKSYLDNSPKMIKERKPFATLYFKVQGMCFDIEREMQRTKDSMNENYFRNYVPEKLIKKRKRA